MLGTGLFQGVVPSYIVVTKTGSGAPDIELTGTTADAASAAGISRVTVSITHKRDPVAAVAMGW